MPPGENHVIKKEPENGDPREYNRGDYRGWHTFFMGAPSSVVEFPVAVASAESRVLVVGVVGTRIAVRVVADMLVR